MFSNIAKAALVATLVVGFASASMARDYDQILQDSGNSVYMNGAPFPYSEYNQSATGQHMAKPTTAKAAVSNQSQEITTDGW